ncbi:hypothetical protein PQS31_01695 [Luteimonas sp BLCC-B24]|uniref:hypothetical protein n=1 Tax=Luteimonas sp. BLCC-B24 TaxID=3025317 RepID=UPI00234D7BE2|nr:hypothetical protein [Luteimonas sp. BLCC-B24]MDC7805544.1 hypothetical protein [Luteimonas sp. BLCC-B24]
MNAEELEDALLAWGRCYGEGRGSEWQEDRSLTGDSPLAAMAGKKAQDSQHDFRSSASRLAFMGTGGKKAPEWSCDPVRATETRSHRPSYDARETPTVIRVQVSWLTLRRVDVTAANVLRIHYQRRALSREERASEAGLKLSAYKDNLRVAKAFIAGNMARPMAA